MGYENETGLFKARVILEWAFSVAYTRCHKMELNTQPKRWDVRHYLSSVIATRTLRPWNNLPGVMTYVKIIMKYFWITKLISTSSKVPVAMVAQVKHTCLPPPRSEFESQPDLMWESWYLLAIGRQFRVQNLDQLYVLVSSALPMTHHNITITVLCMT